MNKQTFSEMTVLGGLTDEARKRLLGCFNEKGEVNSDLFMEHCLMQLQNETSTRIIRLNEQVSNAIRDFVLMRQWTNLNQILRSLPESIRDAVRGTYFEDNVSEWTKEVEEFMSLGSDGRKKALDAVREDK